MTPPPDVSASAAVTASEARPGTGVGTDAGADASADAGAAPRIRVAYLGGLGRSGTTLLARILGELPGVCNVGEVCHLWERGIAADERCGCGRPFSRCPFWTAVGEHAFGGWQNLDLEGVRALHARVDRTRFVPWLATRVPLDHHHVLTSYLHLYERLYRAVAAVSGRPLVLDASKHGSLAYCLRWSQRLDLRVVHCVRDSPAVATSWMRAVQRPEATAGATTGVPGEDLMPVYRPSRTATLWNLNNTMFEMLGRLGTPTRRMRYEDLVADPGPVLGELARFLDLDPPPADLVTGGRVRLASGHSVSGNPMRFTTGTVEIRPDDGWRRELSDRRRRLVTTLTAPYRWRYGYHSDR